MLHMCSAVVVFEQCSGLCYWLTRESCSFQILITDPPPISKEHTQSSLVRNETDQHHRPQVERAVLSGVSLVLDSDSS